MTLKETKNLSANRYELTITISAEELAEGVKKAYESRKNDISIPGFRKGKVPFAMVVKMYGEEAFYEDALNILYPDAVDAAIKESGLKVINDKMDTDIESISKEDGVDFKVTVTTYPEIEVGEYKGLKAEKVIAKVEDSEIDAQINSMADRNARMIAVEDRAAQLGDTAVIDFEGFCDGKAFDGGKAEGHNLELGSGQFIPGFEDQIVGHVIGDEFDVNVTFPEEYHAKELAGKPAVFKCKLHEIKYNELPELDDEFAKDVSEFDTLDEYKADMKAKMEKRNEDKAQGEFENALAEALMEKLVAEIPEPMFEAETENYVRDYDSRLRQSGLDLSTYFKYTGLTLEALREQMRPQAEKQVKGRLALEYIAKVENLTATEEDINTEYQKIADAYNLEIETVKASIDSAAIAADVVVGKAALFLRENAAISTAEEEAK